MNSRYASGKYRFEIRLSEEVPEGPYYRKIENMSNTQETPSAESMPKRRGRFADFFIRLFKEKPLGMLGGVIILLLDALRDLLNPRLRGGQGSYGAAMRKRKRGLLARLINPFS